MSLYGERRRLKELNKVWMRDLTKPRVHLAYLARHGVENG